MKLKKQQKEKERCKKIEKDNYLLLQKLNYITRTSRVDNTWRTPQPNFLNRIPVYNPIVPEIEDLVELDFDYSDDDSKPKSRKSKCIACTPQKVEDMKIPEERVPWEPEKISLNRFRSKSVPVRRSKPLATIQEKHLADKKPSSSKEYERRKEKTHHLETKTMGKHFTITKEPQSIVLSRGCLKLSVNFPSDTVVKFQEGNVEKYLMRGLCHCKLSPT